jgi:quercetin dioxygenase-like cupin family protein
MPSGSRTRNRSVDGVPERVATPSQPLAAQDFRRPTNRRIEGGALSATTHIDYFKPTHLGMEQLPWHPFTPYSDDVLLKVLHVDFVKGETVMMMKAPAGKGLGVHDHYGRVLVYTVQGTWGYDEHDWASKPGDFVYEVANSKHTFRAEPGEDAVLFVYLEGAIAFLDDDGGIFGMETSHTFAKRYEDYCAQNGIEAVDLTKFSLS